MVRGTGAVSEDWGEFDFVALPSPADRLQVIRDGTENYATVLSVHHQPSPVGSGHPPIAEVVAKWTGSGAKLR
ncbi:hypothetical protein A6F68_02302 [Tsuneonella dongtanensis]|uniref:Uncharacterized protein n=2 Tax=Tsuneonella dongtanensis TaxID=692370 RepID=A0A1B2AF69_9SPHN|nr:hypothetical protein A6F68_02302 [Tsuneonella dongtanensis]